MEPSPGEMQRAAAQAELLSRTGGAPAAPTPPPDPVLLSGKEAFAVSFFQLLPMDIPSGARWRLTQKTLVNLKIFEVPFTVYATVHRIVGLVLIACFIFAFAGLRHRIGYRPAPPPESLED